MKATRDPSGETVGAFALYAAEPGVFDAGVTALLEEVSSDLAFALENMDKESRRRRALARVARRCRCQVAPVAFGCAHARSREQQPASGVPGGAG